MLSLFTGSVVLPINALALNALSLTAVLGALVAFGLSMDYEVFLLARLAGQLNWWSPPVLRRLYQRIGLAETAPPAGQAAGRPAATSIAAGREAR